MSIRLLLIIAAVSACSSGRGRPANDGGDGGALGDPPVDAGTVSFARDVHPILAGSCAVVDCHATGTVTNHFNDYATAESTYMRWVGGAGFDFCDDAPDGGLYRPRTIVVPGDPDASYLVEKISAPVGAPCRDPLHHRRMPPEPREPLSPDAIATIVTWIREGALRN